MPRALRENNGATAVSMAAMSSALLLLGRVVTAMQSLEVQVQVMNLSLIWVGLHLLQRVLVGKRRSSGHWFVQYTAMGAHYLPATVVFSAARAFYNSTTHTDEFATPLLVLDILTMLPITIFALSEFGVLFTNMRAYSLRDRPQDHYSFLISLFFLVCVESKWTGNSSSTGLRCVLLGMLIYAAFIIVFINTSKSTLDWETKAFADHMESLNSDFFYSGGTTNSSLQQLHRCRYPFVPKENGGEWFTVRDCVQHGGLTEDKDKEHCLSYSLSRLLARRYYGFPCTEEGDDTVRRFALADLQGTTPGGYKTAFRIVEVQLAFLHDYFFTASLPIIESGWAYIDSAIGFTVMFAMIIIGSLAAQVLALMRDQLLLDVMTTDAPEGSIPILVVIVLLFIYVSWCLLFGEMAKSLLARNLLASYWRPIHTAFRKLKYLPNGPSRPITIDLVRLFRASPNPNAQDVFEPFQTQTDGVYWRNKIGQYSILHDYDRSRSLKWMMALVADWFHRIMLSQPSYEFIKHLPVEEDEVYVHKKEEKGGVWNLILSLFRKKEEEEEEEPDSMRKLVADTLRGIDGPPTNGTRSLKRNRDNLNWATENTGSANYDWLWTCNQKTHTDTILIWHIATCYCDMTPPISDDPSVKRHHEAARALSRYCAYLVAFLPEFLPEHIMTTKQVFQRVMQEAQQELRTEPMKKEKKRTKIGRLQLPAQHEQCTTFQKGVKLGKQLEKLNDDDEELCWRVIAEFWAETILYVAPSDNAEAHIEHLAKGGEFITHLWAMLSNAGILKRATGEWHPPPAPTPTTKRGPPKKIETTKARTQECPF